jgi:hypothetical protein
MDPPLPPLNAGDHPLFGLDEREKQNQARSADFARLIAYDRAALIAGPIRKAEVIYTDVVISGADRRGCSQRGPPAAFAMGHDVIARAETYLLHHGSQNRRRPNNAIV